MGRLAKVRLGEHVVCLVFSANRPPNNNKRLVTRLSLRIVQFKVFQFITSKIILLVDIRSGCSSPSVWEIGFKPQWGTWFSLLISVSVRVSLLVRITSVIVFFLWLGIEVCRDSLRLSNLLRKAPIIVGTENVRKIMLSPK